MDKKIIITCYFYLKNTFQVSENKISNIQMRNGNEMHCNNNWVMEFILIKHNYRNDKIQTLNLKM